MPSRAASEPLMPSRAPLMPTFFEKKFWKKKFLKKKFLKKKILKKKFFMNFFLKNASIYLHAGIYLHASMYLHGSMYLHANIYLHVSIYLHASFWRHLTIFEDTLRFLKTTLLVFYVYGNFEGPVLPDCWHANRIIRTSQLCLGVWRATAERLIVFLLCFRKKKLPDNKSTLLSY